PAVSTLSLHGALPILRVVQDLARVQDRAAGHACLAEDRHHLVLRARAGPGTDQRVELVAVLPAGLRVLATRETRWEHRDELNARSEEHTSELQSRGHL